MRAVIQRVTGSSVEVDGKTVGSCGRGFTVLLGVMNGDTEKEADILAAKVAKLRVDALNCHVNRIKCAEYFVHYALCV